MKLNSKTITVGQHPTEPWMRTLSFPFDRELQGELKRKCPGTQYAPEVGKSFWKTPIDNLEQALKIAKEDFGLESRINTGHELSIPPRNLDGNADLFEYQREGVFKAIDNRRYMLNFEMGLGKTATAIETMRLVDIRTALIICPAIVKYSWEAEIEKWWSAHPEITVIAKGKDCKDYDPSGRITIVSYELSKHFTKGVYDAIVVDESHYIANDGASRSKTVRKILNANRDALTLFLTATPITNEPKQLWHQLDSLYPGRYGTYRQFVTRYCHIESNAYSDWVVKGLFEPNAPELEERLSHVSYRVTKKEVEDLLPPFLVTPIRIKATARKESLRNFTEDFTRMDFHNSKPDAFIRAHCSDKIDAAVQWALDAINEAGCQRVCILTHLKSSAEQIAEALEGKVGIVYHVDGDTPIKQRMAIIEQAGKEDNCVLVCTMHSVKEGINSMVAFDNALLAELYWTPGVMVQVLGRFHRLNGCCNVSLIYLEGTLEEVIAIRLQQKMNDIDKLYERGVTSGKFKDALEKGSTMDDEAFFKELQDVAGKMLQEDGLL